MVYLQERKDKGSFNSLFEFKKYESSEGSGLQTLQDRLIAWYKGTLSDGLFPSSSCPTHCCVVNTCWRNSFKCFLTTERPNVLDSLWFIILFSSWRNLNTENLKLQGETLPICSRTRRHSDSIGTGGLSRWQPETVLISHRWNAFGSVESRFRELQSYLLEIKWPLQKWFTDLDEHESLGFQVIIWCPMTGTFWNAKVNHCGSHSIPWICSPKCMTLRPTFG